MYDTYNHTAILMLSPIPVPIVRIFPLKETLLIPQPEFREGIFLTD